MIDKNPFDTEDLEKLIDSWSRLDSIRMKAITEDELNILKIAINGKLKKAVEKLKEENSEGVRMVVKMYPHKSGEELASEISSYLNGKVLLRIFGNFEEEKE